MSYEQGAAFGPPHQIPRAVDHFRKVAFSGTSGNQAPYALFQGVSASQANADSGNFFAKEQKVFSDQMIDPDGQKEFKQIRLEKLSNTEAHRNGQANDDQTLDDLRAAVAYTRAEQKRRAKLHAMYGFKFTDDDFDQAVRENLENWDAFSKNMMPEEAEEYRDLSLLLLQTEDSAEKQRIRERLGVLSPEATRQTAQRAETHHISESKLAKEETLQNTDGMEEFLSEQSQESIGRLASEIAAPFNTEATQDPFASDQTQEIIVAEKTPSAFVLD